MKLFEFFELSAKVLALLFAVGLLVGGIVTLRYCLHISYYPSGVGVAGSLFLISATLMFLVIYGFYSGLSLGLAGFLLSMLRRPYNWIVDIIRKRLSWNLPRIEKIDESVKALAPTGLLAAFILVLLYLINHPLASAGSLTVALHCFLLLLLSSGTSANPEPLIDATISAGDAKSKRRVVKWTMIGFIIVAPLVLSGAFIFLSQMTMQSIGIYIKEANIGLSGNSAAFVRQAAAQSNATSGAQGAAGADGLLVLKGVEILWTGVGSHTAVRVRSGNEAGLFVFPNAEVLSRRLEMGSN